MVISVVTPVHNEAPNLNELAVRLQKILNEITQEWEVILVDDGSQDDSWNIIEQLHQKNPNFRGVRFSRNFGQQAAYTAGLRHTRGDVVIPMDADLQDPPEVIPSLLEKWKEGFQVVYAIRQRRKEGVLKKWSYRLFYRLLDRIANVRIGIDSGDFCLMDRKVVDALNQLPESHRLVRALRSWVGFRHIGVPYERSERFQGKSKYRFKSLLKLALDGFFTFTFTPIRYAIYLGFFCTIIGLIGLIWALILQLRHGAILPGSAITLCLVLFLGGLQLTCLGIIGEYISRIFDQVKGRPSYIIQETLPGMSFKP